MALPRLHRPSIMSASATESSVDLYNSSLARVKAATPAISLSLERAACEATASNLKGRVVLVTGRFACEGDKLSTDRPV